MNNIRLCLESIYDQDGINPQNVVVAFDSIYGEISDLSALFHVRALPINNSATYNGTVSIVFFYIFLKISETSDWYLQISCWKVLIT